MQDAINDCDPACASAEPYMQLAIYDLLGALFATPDLPAVSAHSDRLFMRICNIIKDRFADPDFSFSDVATEAGISLRYLQKLFTAREFVLHAFHTFGPPGSCRTSVATPGLAEHAPALQPDRIRERI
jgi:hypothetical protein